MRSGVWGIRNIRIIEVLLVCLLCVLAAGCEPDAVDELGSWDGKPRTWVIDELGKPDSSERIGAAVPDIGTGQTVADKIQKRSPGYNGQVEHLRWKKGRYYYDVFLILVDKDWIVADAVKWHEDVQF